MLGAKSHAPTSGALMGLGVNTNTGSTVSRLGDFICWATRLSLEQQISFNLLKR